MHDDCRLPQCKAHLINSLPIYHNFYLTMLSVLF